VDDHSLDFAFIDGQVEQFEKLALNPTKLLKLTEAGKGRALGSLAGGLIGAGAGAATAEEGQRGAGALRGALAGGALGLAGGQVATGQGRRQITRAAQRQAHGLTGYMPGAYKKEKGIRSAFGKGLSADDRLQILRNMRMGDLPEVEDVADIRKARNILTGLRQRAKPGDILEKSNLGAQKLQDVQSGMITKFLPENVQRGIANLGVRRQVARLDQAEKGLTAAPQFMKSLITDPKATATTGMLAAGGVGVGLPVAMSAPQVMEAAKNRDPEELGASLAETGFYTMSGGLPMLGSMALGGGVRRLGGAPGAFYKKMMGKDKQPQPEYDRVGAGRLVG